MRRSLDIEEHEEFIVDRPFAFIILDSINNFVVFVGRYKVPETKQSENIQVHDEL